MSWADLEIERIKKAGGVTEEDQKVWEARAAQLEGPPTDFTYGGLLKAAGFSEEQVKTIIHVQHFGACSCGGKAWACQITDTHGDGPQIENELLGLSVGAKNRLYNNGIYTRKQLELLIDSGRLFLARHIGHSYYTEIVIYLGRNDQVKHLKSKIIDKKIGTLKRWIAQKERLISRYQKPLKEHKAQLELFLKAKRLLTEQENAQ